MLKSWCWCGSTPRRSPGSGRPCPSRPCRHRLALGAVLGPLGSGCSGPCRSRPRTSCRPPGRTDGPEDCQRSVLEQHQNDMIHRMTSINSHRDPVPFADLVSHRTRRAWRTTLNPPELGDVIRSGWNSHATRSHPRPPLAGVIRLPHMTPDRMMTPLPFSSGWIQQWRKPWTTAWSQEACRPTRCERTRPVHASARATRDARDWNHRPETTLRQFGLTNVCCQPRLTAMNAETSPPRSRPTTRRWGSAPLSSARLAERVEADHVATPASRVVLAADGDALGVTRDQSTPSTENDSHDQAFEPAPWYSPWSTYIDAREEARRRGDRKVGPRPDLGLLREPVVAQALDATYRQPATRSSDGSRCARRRRHRRCVHRTTDTDRRADQTFVEADAQSRLAGPFANDTRSQDGNGGIQQRDTS